MNLFENAVRHATGVSRVEVTAGLSATEDAVVIRVADDGPGIPADHAGRVFLPHERAMTEGPGAGLGLAIARGIVEAHGGTIGLEPAPIGTVVRVELPVEPVSGSAPRP